MRAIKWMIAAIIGLSVTLFTAAISGYFSLNADLSKLPAIMPSPLSIELNWSVTYVLSTLIIARSIMIRDRTTTPALFFIKGMLYAVWTYLFFAVGSVKASFVAAMICLCYIAYLFAYMTRKDGISAILLIPEIIWLSFLTIVNTMMVKAG